MRIPLLDGRGLTGADRDDGRAVAVVSRSFADRYWPGLSPIGRRFRTGEDAPWLEVVGVSGDIMHDWFMNQRRPTFYRPVAQDAGLSLAIVVRTTGNPLDMAGELRRAVTAADPDQPILELRSMEQVVADKVGGIVYLARALAVMGGIALVLALMGVYSLIAYLAARRTQEFGVRMALGATRWQVIRLNVRQALVITGLGLAMGTGHRHRAGPRDGVGALRSGVTRGAADRGDGRRRRRHRAGGRVPPRRREGREALNPDGGARDPL